MANAGAAQLRPAVDVPDRSTARTPALCDAPDSAGLLYEQLDVGQGDAALLRTSERTILVDGGPTRLGVLAQLRARSVTAIDWVVASHNHQDHIEGLPAVLAALPVAAVMENGREATTVTYRRFVDAITTSQARLLRNEARTVTLGSLKVEVWPPSPASRDQNEASIGMAVRYGAFVLVLTGDAEQQTLLHWLQAGVVPRAQVVKAGHHGSADATSMRWVQQLRPAVAVISAGSDNSYGHPHAMALAQWNSVGAQILRTDQLGDVAIRGCLDGTFHTVF